MAKLRKYSTKGGFIYAVDFYFHGKRYVRSTKTSNYRLAKQILADIEGKIARGNFKLEEYSERHTLLSDFLTEYFRYAESYKKSGTISLEKIVTNTFKSLVGDVDLRNIGQVELDIWKSSRLRSVRPATFNIELRTLRAILNIAKRWGYLADNPLDQVRKVRVEEKRLFMTTAELQRFFEQLAVVAQAAERKPRKDKMALLGPYYEFLLNTGLRREEALDLQLSEIDFEHNLVLVRKSKDKEARVVPMTERAREILDSLGTGLFKALSKSYVTHNFTDICRKAELTGFKLHSLRHTFATRLVNSGVDILTVSKIMGHSDIKTTMIYAKVRLETLKNAVEKFETGKLPVRKWYIEGRDGNAPKNQVD